MNSFEGFRKFFSKTLWEYELSGQSQLKDFLIRVLRLFYVAFYQFSDGQLNLRATGLVYTTLLSLVPLLAVSFSVLMAFGVNDFIEPFLDTFLAPLGTKGMEASTKILDFVKNMKVGVLGSVGIVLLIYTIVSLVYKIEEAFNYIWRVSKPRSHARRFSDFMSVLLIGPVLIFGALGLTASVMSSTVVKTLTEIEPFGSLIYYGAKLLPYLFVCFAFTFVYVFVPSTKVKLSSAFIGGIFSAVLWQTTGMAFSSFVVSSASKYTAIYSGFAILIFFMLWLYASWLILLVGASISYYHQYPQILAVKNRVFLLSGSLKEHLALLVMYHIGKVFLDGDAPWSLNQLVVKLKIPVESVNELLKVLINNNILSETGDDPPCYLPARAIETITLKQIIDVVRKTGDDDRIAQDNILKNTAVDSIVDEIEKSLDSSLGAKNLRELISRGD